MKLKNLFLMMISVTLTTGCATRFQQNEAQILTYSDNSIWANEIRQTADKTFLYSLLAENVYIRDDFNLPQTIELLDDVQNDDVGMAYNVYKNTNPSLENDGVYEIIIVFRGSEPNWLDWITGNALGKQLPRALDVYDDIKSNHPEGTKIAVTGHSLGGSLATQISLCHRVEASVSFNTSPRFKSKLCAPNTVILGKNNRYSIVERGEFLKATRIFGREATQLYTSIDCSKFGPIGDHSMQRLATCLTIIASENPSSGADEIIKLNPQVFKIVN